jgi:hypothetical protein
MQLRAQLSQVGIVSDSGLQPRAANVTPRFLSLSEKWHSFTDVSSSKVIPADLSRRVLSGSRGANIPSLVRSNSGELVRNSRFDAVEVRDANHGGTLT